MKDVFHNGTQKILKLNFYIFIAVIVLNFLIFTKVINFNFNYLFFPSLENKAKPLLPSALRESAPIKTSGFVRPEL